MRSILFGACLLAGGVPGCQCNAQDDKEDKDDKDDKDDEDDEDDEDEVVLPAGWVPTLGLPLPGHGEGPTVPESAARPLTPDEMVSIARAVHPTLDPAQHSIEEYNRLYWDSPEQQRLFAVQQGGYSRLDRWHELCAAVRRQIPGDYVVADRTYPRYDPAYVVVVDAPMQPESIEEANLVVHVSYLVPYYSYYQLDSRRIDGLIQRDPLRYEVTPVFAEVLAVIEREIERRYGYWFMAPETAAIQIAGIDIGGYNDWMFHPPTLMDALFTPHRW